jgi:hypothetical protein
LTGCRQVVQSSDVVRARRHGADGGERCLQELLHRLLSVEAEDLVGNLGIVEQSGEHDLAAARLGRKEHRQGAPVRCGQAPAPL